MVISRDRNYMPFIRSRSGSDSARQSDALPRCVRPEQQAPCVGDTGQARQGH